MQGIGKRHDYAVKDTQHNREGEQSGQAARPWVDALFLIELHQLVIIFLLIVRVQLLKFLLLVRQLGLGSHASLLFDRHWEQNNL